MPTLFFIFFTILLLLCGISCSNLVDAAISSTQSSEPLCGVDSDNGVSSHCGHTQPKVSNSAEDFDAALAVFWKWLRSENINELPVKFANMEVLPVSPESEHRGVFALEKIPADTRILEVPLSRIITTELAKASPMGQQLHFCDMEANRESSTHTYLAVYLLDQRRKPESIWQPYIGALPTVARYARHVPIFFNDSVLDTLKGSFVLPKIAQRKLDLSNDYHAVSNCLGEDFFNSFSLEDFIWARLVVITRIFGFHVSGQKLEGLVPLADLLNHQSPSKPKDTVWEFNEEANAFTMTTQREIQSGEEIYDSYGRKCNWRFFVNYGFVLENNEQDNQAVIHFQIPAGYRYLALKLHLLGDEAPTGTALSSSDGQLPEHFYYSYQLPMHFSDKLSRSFFSLLRLLNFHEDEFMNWMWGVTFDGHVTDIEDIPPFSLRNELEVLSHIQQIVENRLLEFPTTFDEDEKLLMEDEQQKKDTGHGKLTEIERNVLVVLKGEKEVLQYYYSLFSAAEPLVRLDKHEFALAAGELQQMNTNSASWAEKCILDYLIDVIIPLIEAHHQQQQTSSEPTHRHELFRQNEEKEDEANYPHPPSSQI